jgi:hypothetical protein
MEFKTAQWNAARSCSEREIRLRAAMPILRVEAIKPQPDDTIAPLGDIRTTG